MHSLTTASPLPLMALATLSSWLITPSPKVEKAAVEEEVGGGSGVWGVIHQLLRIILNLDNQRNSYTEESILR
jgi:hypothetical protein